MFIFAEHYNDRDISYLFIYLFQRQAMGFATSLACYKRRERGKELLPKKSMKWVTDCLLTGF